MPEATAAAIVDDWMHTGDLQTVDEENYIYIVDRAKDMIISGGENIYSVEVENALYTHPAVLEVAVIGIPHDVWGEAVHAVVVCKPGMNVTAGDLIAHARTQIAGYKVLVVSNLLKKLCPRVARARSSSETCATSTGGQK